LDSSPRRLEFTESLLGVHTPLDGSVILLDDVIQVAARTNFHTAPANIFLGKQLQRSQRCLIAIDIDFLSYSGTYWSTQRIMVV